MPPHLQAALNGARTSSEHPAIPHTPDELAREARAAVAAGADVVHVHAFDDAGVETLEAGPCAATLRAIRAACPGTKISLTTTSAIEPDPARRLALVSAWDEQPDLVTANLGEPGILELIDLLLERGVGIEAGLMEIADAHAFVSADIAGRCVRVLLEPLDADPRDAIALASSMEHVLELAGISLEQVHHGDGIASWDVSARALARGHGMRTGLEDTVVLPDGSPAADNAELVRYAKAMID
jgi:uncharacterized protein (DUF849 family)